MMDGLPAESPFAPLEWERIIFENETALAFYDRYPVSPGHALVVAKKVTASYFDLPDDVQDSVWAAVRQARTLLLAKYKPAAFNVGINDGMAAGQTVAHAHIHIIPRYPGDQPDPRGGIRRIFPHKANYWD